MSCIICESEIMNERSCLVSCLLFYGNWWYILALDYYEMIRQRRVINEAGIPHIQVGLAFEPITWRLDMFLINNYIITIQNIISECEGHGDIFDVCFNSNKQNQGWDCTQKMLRQFQFIRIGT